LTTWVILFITSDVAVSALITVGQQRRSLFRDSLAKELYELLSKGWVVGVHGPRCSAVVRIDVPLRFGDSACESSICAFTGSQVGSFSKVYLVDSSNKTGETKRRLGDSERKANATGWCLVSNAEFQ
jgi:hypothetical protein